MEKKKDIILCMYSGGLASLGVLHQLLTAEQYQKYFILIHHIHILNIDERANAEDFVANKALQYFKKLNKAFAVSTSKHDYRCLTNAYNFDVRLVAFMAASLCRNDPRIKKIAWGGTTKSDKAYGQQIAKGRLIFNTLLNDIPAPKRPEYIFPASKLSREQIYQMLPEELQDSFWSCHKPSYVDKTPQICGVCVPCAQMQDWK